MYRKIMIEGKEENLPKEDGRYISGVNDPDIVPYNTIFKNDRDTKRDWLEEIDWFLQPVSREEIIELQNKILKGFLTAFQNFRDFDVMNDSDDEISEKFLKSNQVQKGIESIADELIGGDK